MIKNVSRIKMKNCRGPSNSRKWRRLIWLFTKSFYALGFGVAHTNWDFCVAITKNPRSQYSSLGSSQGPNNKFCPAKQVLPRGTSSGTSWSTYNHPFSINVRWACPGASGEWRGVIWFHTKSDLSWGYFIVVSVHESRLI